LEDRNLRQDDCSGSVSNERSPGIAGAFAPSETFSPNLPVPISGRPRIKRSGRGECPVPPRLMGHTPSGLKFNHGPDGAFAPSETFSPNLPVPINGRPRIKRSGRGECPVPLRLMGHTPSGLSYGPDGAFAPSETFSPNLPVPINGRPRIKRSGRGECPVPPRLMGHTPSGLRTDVQSWAGRGIRPVRNVFSEPAGSNQRSATDQTFGTGRMPRPAAVDEPYPVRLGLKFA